MHHEIDEVIIIVIAGTALVSVLTSFIIGFFVIHKRKRRFAELSLKNLEVLYESRILISQVEIQEQIFEKMSMEIHDNVGQILTLAKVNLNTLEETSLKDSRKIEDCRNFISKALSDLRAISRGMNPGNIKDLGLEKALDSEIDNLSSAGLFAIEFIVIGSKLQISSGVSLIVFRVCQEALNNIVKHARCASVSVTLKYSTNSVKIVIIDDGVGMESIDLSTNGQGLRNMKRRIEAVAGIFKYSTAPSQGVTIDIEFPVGLEDN